MEMATSSSNLNLQYYSRLAILLLSLTIALVPLEKEHAY